MRTLIALLCLCSSSLVMADDYPFERLFTASAERAQLDRMRDGVVPPPKKEAPGKVVAVSKLDEETTKVRFSGFVRRGDGEIRKT